MEDEKKPDHPAVEAVNSLGCFVLLLVGMLLWAGTCGIGPWG